MVDAGSTPEWWDSAKQAISTSDILLNDVIEEFEEPSLRSRGDLFATLIKSIVGQQNFGSSRLSNMVPIRGFCR